ncbi:MAG: hypothetical protein V4729_12720 [Pseudomonadota bacterium]
MTTLSPDGAAPSRRSRAPATAEAASDDADQRRLQEAARRLLIRVGSRSATVELFLAESGLSRERFRRHCLTAQEPLEALVRTLHERLVARLLVAVADIDEPVAAVEAGLLAYRQWGEELGPLLGPLQAERHDPHSPVSRHRRDTLEFLAVAVAGLAERFGRPRPPRLQIDTALQGLEYLGFRFHLEGPRDDAAWKQTRDAMLRLALGLLGTREDWEHAADLADTLDIAL